MALSARARSVWAKFGYDPESDHWLPLWLHLLDAAALAEHLAGRWLAPTTRDLIERELAGSASDLSPTEEFLLLASWVAGVHDIGKCTPAFSCQVGKLDDRMKEVGLRHEQIDPLERRRVPHALAGHLILRSWLTGEHGWGHGPANALASVVGAHHGIPPTKAALTNELSGHEHLLGDDAWAAARRELLDLVTARTGAEPLLPGWAKRRWSQPFLVELSGLVIVADWIASTEAYFPLLPLDDDGARLLAPGAHAGRAAAGLSRLEIPAPWRPRDDGADPDSLLAGRFDLPAGARATDVQARTLAAARAMELPGLLVVEESTGGGKTEAALMAAEVLAARTGRAGVLFALPTQATTDAMFSRELSWLERIEEAYAAGGAPSDFAVQLLHGRARLNEEARPLRRRGYEIRDRLLGSLGGQEGAPRPAGIGWDEEEARGGQPLGAAARRRADLAILSWFNGRKKAMLSDFVVTTVDHLLFGAMRSPHLAMRHLGLSRKVVVVDEVHSYSTYMNVYLDRALTWLAFYGVPVVLLSATLSEARCTALVDAYRRGLRLAAGERVPRRPAPEALRTPFPCLVTAGRERTEVVPTSASGRRSTVRVRRLTRDALVPLLTESLADGGCALVVRNTVRRAQETYELLRETFGEDVSLNHARFTIRDRLAKDDDLRRRFGPPRARPSRPHRAIVVATQVVEQSLDVDFDLLVSDLAPIDLVLQRMGRLHRHERRRPVRLTTPTCYVDWLPATASDDPAVEAGAKAIYGEQDMLMSAAALDRVLGGPGIVTVPDDVHDLIEAVYGTDAPVPPRWQGAVAQARQEHDVQRKKKHDAAKAFLLEEPERAGARTSLIGWLHTTASDSEDKGRAQVRDGEDSLEVILLELRRVGGQEELRTLQRRSGEPGRMIPTDRVPDPKVVRAMVMSAVRLPASLSNARVIDKVIQELEIRVVPAWQDDRDLQGQLFLLLEDGRAQLAGTVLEYSPSTGLKEVRSQ
ncbi:CRISPR-associated helicase Cas3' [Actinomyces israelii]|uniref:CRISPR-associated helicase Cas3' n=1 Tax=Actinomyces israelii TaxID=1659 RepID=UPI002555D719|nr:CRISPR-associated helicase Cas3' [Actinomyces israelii]WKR21191.1 CRISPR-associated nuclease/helicase Cas3 [Actinomyces israelii]